jgi:GTP cyclohydrolase I
MVRSPKNSCNVTFEEIVEYEEIVGYDEMVLLRDLGFVSHCDHQMARASSRMTTADYQSIVRANKRWLATK